MTMQEKLGIKKIGNTNTAKGCAKRAADIRRLVSKKKLSEDLKRRLLSQASWYQSKANRLSKVKSKSSKRKAA